MSTAVATPQPDLGVLVALESPMLDGLAPELVALRDRARGLAEQLENPKGCSSCARNRVRSQFTQLATEFDAMLQAQPKLAELLPTLITTARQSWQHQ